MSYLPRLWTHITPRRRKQFGLLLVLMVIASFAEVLSIGAVLPFLGVLTNPEQLYGQTIVQPIIKILNISEPRQLLLPLTVAFSLAVLLSGAMRLILLWAQTRLSHAVGGDLSISIYRRTLYQPYAVHVARNSSEVIAGVSQKASEVVHLIMLPALIIISSSIMLFAVLFALLAIEPIVALSALAGFGIIYVVIIGFTKKLITRNSQSVSSEQNKVIKALQEGLGGIRDVLINGTQAVYCKSFQRADLTLRRARANIQIVAGSPRFGVEAFGMVLFAALAFTLSGNEGKFSNTIPVLGALALGAQRLLPVLQQTYANWTYIRGGQASLRDALDLLDQPIPEYADEPLPEPIRFQNSVVLEKLAFRYSPEDVWVLKGVDLMIQKGNRVGFIGTTGSGKSTLLDIIMGLLRPTVGHLRIDGQAITLNNHRAWQAHIAHVPQFIFLADSTISENIAFGIPVEMIDHDRVREVAQKAQIAATIESLDQQYNTKVGEDGIRLSGGQRQRIGIARALYRQSDVIVFDEATSALDAGTERAVMEAIDNISEEITVLIVAHRLTTLKGCGQVVELDNGSIKRIGTYQDVIEKINKEKIDSEISVDKP